MRILLDTHYLIWLFTDTGKIPEKVMGCLKDEENDLFYSQISLWEIAIKKNIGKINFEGFTFEELYDEIRNASVNCLETYDLDIITSHTMPRKYGDPFDHILAWQAIRNDMVLLSADSKIDSYVEFGLKLL